MKSGELYINGKDAWNTWGVFLLDDGYDTLDLSAGMKEPIVNKNRNEHGSRVILNNIKKDSREVILSFFIQADNPDDFRIKKKSFTDEIESGWILLAVVSQRTAYQLYLNSPQDLKSYSRIGRINIRFTEPNPNDRKELDENGDLLTHFAKTFPNIND